MNKPQQEKAQTDNTDKRIGNKFWQVRNKHGRDPIYETAEQLLSDCEDYFDWVDKNPLEEEKIFSYQGEIISGIIRKMRPMTLKGLCLHLGITDSTWANYRLKNDFLGVIERVESIIYTQKFEGAAANLFNANIIARELGLKDSTELVATTNTPRNFNDFYAEVDAEGESI